MKTLYLINTLSDNDKIANRGKNQKLFMFKKLFRKSFISISLVGVGTAFNAGLGFIYLSAVARNLTVSDFGKYALLASLLLSISKILDFGTNSLYVADKISENGKHPTNAFISNKFIQLVVAIPIAFLALYLLKLNSLQILVFFILGVIFYGIYYTIFGLFQRKEKYLMLVLMASIPALIKGFIATLILTGIVNWDFTSYFGVFSLSIGTSIIFTLFIPGVVNQFRFNFSRVVEDLKKAFSPGISQLITESFPAISNTLTKLTFGFTDVGIFSLADKLSSVFVLISFSIFTVLLPKNAARKRDNESYDYIETAVLSIGVLMISIIAIIAARFLIPWFFENKYNDSLKILNILIFSGGATAIHTFIENYFYVEEKTSILGAISIGKLAYYIIIAAILIPFYALRGLAVAHLSASLLTLSTMLFIVLREKRKGPVLPLSQ